MYKPKKKVDRPTDDTYLHRQVVRMDGVTNNTLNRCCEQEK